MDHFEDSSQSTQSTGMTPGSTVRTRWTKEEDEVLKRSAAHYRYKHWKEVAEDVNREFGGSKTAIQCSHRWSKVLDPNITKGPWTQQEDELLRNAVQSTANPNKVQWRKVKIPNRTTKQCRERWVNHLKPHLKTSKFTMEEDQKLLEAHVQMGNKWAEISKQLPGRTDNDVKNRWNLTYAPYIRGLNADSESSEFTYGREHIPKMLEEVHFNKRRRRQTKRIKSLSENPGSLSTNVSKEIFSVRTNSTEGGDTEASQPKRASRDCRVPLHPNTATKRKQPVESHIPHHLSALPDANSSSDLDSFVLSPTAFGRLFSSFSDITLLHEDIVYPDYAGGIGGQENTPMDKFHSMCSSPGVYSAGKTPSTPITMTSSRVRTPLSQLCGNIDPLSTSPMWYQSTARHNMDWAFNIDRDQACTPCLDQMLMSSVKKKPRPSYESSPATVMDGDTEPTDMYSRLFHTKSF